MQTISTDIFTIKIPKVFDLLKTSKILIRAEDTQTHRDVQGPLVSVTMFMIKDLDTDVYSGNTLQEKFEDSCLSLSYKSEKLRGEKTSFKGYETFILHAHSDAPWQNTHFKIRYFYAGVVLDDSYILEFRALHEKLPSDELADWVLPAFESLKILGKTGHRDQAWQQHALDIEQEERNYQADRAAKEEEAYQAKKNTIYDTAIPDKEEAIFEIGDFDFQLVKEKPVCTISDFDGMLAIEITGKSKKHKAGTRKKLLSEYNDTGEVKVRLSVKDILRNGKLSGNFRYEDGRTGAPYWLHIRFEGLDYGLDFRGNVVLKDQWVIIAGELSNYGDTPIFKVRIAKKINETALNWSLYRFSSIEETKTMAPEKVRLLALENPSFRKLPEAIFTFENLVDLSITQRSQNWESEKLPLTEIQPEIGRLTNLTKFHLNGASLEKLPENIVQLEQLEHLSVNNCKIKTLPEKIWQLPNLKYLWLSSNQLTEIPEAINLPELQSISLEKNRLRTLPEALAQQPKLKKINLNDNPLEQLPSAFNAMERIDLAMEDKLRLLDFEYKGADGKGTVGWDDSIFWSQHDLELIPEVDEVLKTIPLTKHRSFLRALVKKSIGFRHTQAEDYALVGNHRFGGMPDLPKKLQYPEFFDTHEERHYKYEFIAQVNCAEIAHLQDYLPKKGMLYFFLETFHNVYHDKQNPCKVLYVKDRSEIVSGRRFKIVEADYYEMMGDAYASFKVEARKMNSAPSFYASYVNTHLFLGAESMKDDEEFLEEAYEVFEEPINERNKFEYAINAHGFSQHEQPELQASLHRKGKPEDWMILLTVTSAGDMQWGDAGDLFFVIHKSDLAKQDFNNVFVTLESS